MPNVRTRFRPIPSIITGCSQFTGTLAVLWLLYMWLALMDFEGGIDGIISLFIIEPVLGGIIALLTIAACFCAGYPIRHFHSLRSWWIRHWYAGIGLLATGLLLYILSQMPAFRDTIPSRYEETGRLNTSFPNSVMLLTSWFLIAFSLLHAYLPRFTGGKKSA